MVTVSLALPCTEPYLIRGVQSQRGAPLLLLPSHGSPGVGGVADAHRAAAATASPLPSAAGRILCALFSDGAGHSGKGGVGVSSKSASLGFSHVQPSL